MIPRPADNLTAAIAPGTGAPTPKAVPAANSLEFFRSIQQLGERWKSLRLAKVGSMLDGGSTLPPGPISEMEAFGRLMHRPRSRASASCPDRRRSDHPWPLIGRRPPRGALLGARRLWLAQDFREREFVDFDGVLLHELRHVLLAERLRRSSRICAPVAGGFPPARGCRALYIQHFQDVPAVVQAHGPGNASLGNRAELGADLGLDAAFGEPADLAAPWRRFPARRFPRGPRSRTPRPAGAASCGCPPALPAPWPPPPSPRLWGI